MRSLWLISILLILAAGCVSIKPKGLTRIETGTRDTGHGTESSHLSRFTLYKATLDIRKHHLTGLLVVKRMDSATSAVNAAPASYPVYRIVFANEIGMTFFDFELRQDCFKVISCFESLNKNALIKIFETDFRLLTGIDSLQKVNYYLQPERNMRVISAKAGSYKIWQTYSQPGDTLHQTAGKSNIADPVIISFLKYADGFPSKITVENPFIGMKLSLRLLDRR